MAKPTVKFVSLGGVGEVGKNCNVVECGNDLLVLDAGVMFPSEEMHGIDLVIPDFEYVRENQDRLRGILITHGHEDHIGSLPYLLSQLRRKVPIYGSKLTLGFVKVKLAEHRQLDKADFHNVEGSEQVRLGSLRAEFIPVAHSVPDSRSIAIHTPLGIVFDTGDFKFEGAPSGGTTDIRKLAQLGDRGVLALLSDCVRVEKPGHTPSESVVAGAMERIVSTARGRIILSTFASNITRVQQMIRIAYRFGRKAAVVGRSIAENLQVARDLGYVEIPDDTLISVQEMRKLPPDQIVLLVTGAQGEPTSVLSRIAVGDHPQIAVTAGDTIIIAASPIPGNEETVAHTIDNLYRQGATVIYEAVVPDIHVSGHASRGDLEQMIRLLKPDYCVPIHGEYRHMVHYRDLAVEMGVPPENVFIAEVGEAIEFGAKGARIDGKVPSGSVLVDGVVVGGVTKAVLRERGRLAEDGVVIASLAVDRETGMIVGGPDIVSLGFAQVNGAALLDAARERVVKSLSKQRKGEVEYGYIVSKISNVLGGFIYSKTRRRPLILPVITEV